MDIQTIAVLVIVLAAAGLLLRKYIRAAQGSGCGCGCSAKGRGCPGKKA